MKLKVIQFSTLLLLILVTGVFWGTWFSLSRSIELFTAQAFLEIGKVIIQNLAWPMRVMMPATILLMLIHLWVYPVKKSRAFFLYVQSFILLMITLLITLLVLVPLDNEFKVWTQETIPSDWQQSRDKWEFYHTIRTFTCIGSIATYLAAIIFLKTGKSNEGKFLKRSSLDAWPQCK
jgi:uncharacterized membrane protein